MQLMPDEHLELPRLLDAVRHRDEAAARLLVERLGPLVLRVVRADRARRVAEEDLCQEVFMSVFASLEQFRGAVPLEHWVARIAVNTCIDSLRRERNRPELRWADLSEPEGEALQEMLADTAAPDTTEQQFAMRELVDRLLDTLDPADRLLIQWLDLEEKSVREVRALTGWGASMVKVRAFRARRRMRKALGRIQRKEQP
jgi:RNA polymerase sigma-70 factor (ECF subfamily)